MLDSPIFTVIFGLLFLFSLLSIIVTQLNTLTASVLNWRAKHLKQGIATLLTDPVTRAKFLAHPLIGLVPAVVQPSAQLATADAKAVSASEAAGVEWIPAELFSQVLFDILNSNAESELFGHVTETMEQKLVGLEKAQMREMLRRFQFGGITISELQIFINTKISDPTDRDALLKALTSISSVRQPDSAADEQSRLLPLLMGIDQIEDPSMRTALQALVGPALSLKAAQSRIESWFRNHMDRLTASYRRRLTWVSVVIGILMAVLLNADTLFMGRTLWNDPALTETLVRAADTALASGTLSTTITQTQEDQTSIAIPTPAAAPDTNDPSAIDATLDANAQTADAQAAGSTTDQAFQLAYSVQDLLALRLPLGWTFEAVEGGCPQTARIPDPCSNGRNLWLLLPLGNPSWFSDFLIKLVGLAITVIAIAQGAPFWFDLLARIARGRNANDNA